jgi:diguanylate cyclase (GGDEF)-like protein
MRLSVDLDGRKYPKKLLFSQKNKNTKKNATSPPPANWLQESNKISTQLLFSLKSIKKTTKNLLSLGLDFSDYKLSQSLGYLEKELIRLETLIRKRDYYVQEIRDLGYLAFNDSLTGLPNRHFFERVVKSLIQEGQHQFYLTFIDIDNFKRINDTYGHEFGDLLLKSVAARIKRELREGDIIARYGGDEFVALIYYRNTQDIDRIMQRLLDINSPPHIIYNKEICIQLSLGVAAYPEHSTTYEDLIGCSDQAMYLAKQSGKNSYQVSPMFKDAWGN